MNFQQHPNEKYWQEASKFFEHIAVIRCHFICPLWECSIWYFYFNSKKANKANREVKELLIFVFIWGHFYFLSLFICRHAEYLWPLQCVPLRLIVLQAQTHSFPPINVAALLQAAPPGSSFPFAWDLFSHPMKKDLIWNDRNWVPWQQAASKSN